MDATCIECDPNYTTKYTGSVLSEQCNVGTYVLFSNRSNSNNNFQINILKHVMVYESWEI